MKLIELLEKARDVIAVGFKFKIAHWHEGIIGEKVDIKECGTACCIVGWMVALLGDKMDGGNHNIYCSNLESYYDLEELFYVYSWDEFLDPEDWDKLYAEVEAVKLDEDDNVADKDAWLNAAFDRLSDDRRAYWASIAINAYIDTWRDYLDKEVTLEDIE